jgi:hypothetical protein
MIRLCQTVGKHYGRNFLRFYAFQLFGAVAGLQ